MFKSVLKTFLINLLLGLCALGGYYYFLEQQKPLDVETVFINKGSIGSYIRVTGKIVNDNTVKLAALVDGEIKTLKVNIGDHVKKNQLLVSFDDTTNIHLVQRAQAEQKLQTHVLEAARLRLKRLQKLARTGAITHEELEEAQTDVQQGQASLEVAKENLIIEKLRLEKTKLHAPYSGVITEKFAGKGQWMESGTPLLVLVSDSGREIEAQIDASDLSTIQIGSNVEVSADSYPNKSWKERIKRISPSILVDKNNSSNTFPVRFSLSTNAPNLLLNQQVDIKLTIAYKKNALITPLSTLIEHQDKYQILIIKNGKAKYITVETGIESYTHVEITKGLNLSLNNPHETIEIIIPDSNNDIEEGKVVNGINSTM